MTKKETNPLKLEKNKRFWKNISRFTGFWRGRYWREGVPQKPKKDDENNKDVRQRFDPIGRIFDGNE